MSNYVSCIVAAGGSGTRIGADINKLFLEIGGVAVIAHALMVLEKSETVSEIIVSAREEDIMQISEYAQIFNITKLKSIVKGGATRAESVLAAQREISDECNLVMVHDAARPFVTELILTETVNAAEKFGAAACGVKPKCTLKSVNDDGFITGTVDRAKTVEIQTPQVFKKELFDKMYSLSIDTIKKATDDCVLAEKCDAVIFVTEGSYKNIKITTPEDLEIAEIFLRRH